MQALLKLPLAPAGSETLTVKCVSAQPGLLSLAFAGGVKGATVTSSGASAAVALGPGSAAPSALLLTIAALLQPSPHPQPQPSQVLCTLTSAGGSRADPLRYRAVQALALPTLHLPPHLPLFTDVLVEVAPLQFRSAWSDALTLLPAPAGLPGALSNTSSRNLQTYASAVAAKSSAWLDRNAVYARADAASAALSAVSRPPTAGAWLSLTLTDSTHLVLVGPAAHPYSAGPAFLPNATAVFLGGAPATVNWVLNQPGGPSLLSLVTPPLADLCSAAAQAAGSCGLQTLLVSASGPGAAPLDAALLARLAQTPDADASGGIVSLLVTLPPLPLQAGALSRPLYCPPACGASAVLLATAMTALPPTARAPAFLTDPLSATGGGGVTYAAPCPGAYTDPASGACVVASNPASFGCALGAGDACATCPAGALCPGAFVQWPRPGYTLVSGAVVACEAPALARCAGFDAGNAQTRCGPGYKQGTAGCSGCAAAYFADPSGACLACPATDLLRSLLLPLLYTALSFAALFCLVALCSWRAARRHGTSAASARSAGVGLLMWMWCALQLLVTGARAASGAGTPPWLLGLVSALRVLQFDGVTLNPSCFAYIPFLTQWVILGVVGACVLLLGAFATAWAWERRRSAIAAAAAAAAAANAALHDKQPPGDAQAPSWLLPLLHRHSSHALTLLCLLYATALNAATQVVSCIPARDTVRNYLALQQSGAQLAAAPSLAQWQSLLGAGSSQQLLQAHLFSAAPLASLPPALQEAAPAILAAQLDFAVLATNPFQVCYEGPHTAIFSFALAVLVCLVGFPLLSFFAVRYALRERMGDESVVGKVVVRQWKEVGAHWLPLPGTFTPLLASPNGGGAVVPQSTTVSGIEEAEAVAAAVALAAATAAKRQLAAAAEQAERAAALLDATPRAYAGPAAPLLHPWTVGDRRPSRFYFSQVEQAVLLVLTLVGAFDAGSERGAGGGTPYMPYAQAQALQGLALGLTLGCMGALAYATTALDQFHELDDWKRRALLGVLALTALSALLRFVTWAGGSGAAGAVQALAGLLFAGTLSLLLHLLRSFVTALESACRAEAAAAAAAAGALGAQGGKAAGSEAEGRAFSVRNPILGSPESPVRMPLGRGRGAGFASELARRQGARAEMDGKAAASSSYES